MTVSYKQNNGHFRALMTYFRQQDEPTSTLFDIVHGLNIIECDPNCVIETDSVDLITQEFDDTLDNRISQPS